MDESGKDFITDIFMLTAFYAGSFDPITHGHIDVIRQALHVAHKLVVGIGVHHGKEPLFDASARLSMIMESCQPIAAEMGRSIEVVCFGDLTVQAARRHGASLLVRGLRDGTDLDYEMQIAGMNDTMAPEIQTVFFPASPKMRPITGTLVRQIASLGGDVSSFVPDAALRALDLKFKS